VRGGEGKKGGIFFVVNRHGGGKKKKEGVFSPLKRAERGRGKKRGPRAVKALQATGPQGKK